MNVRYRNGLISTLAALGLLFRREATGSAVIEFALLAPVLFMLLIGMFQFGILINNYIQLTEAVRVGGRTLAISRGSTTPIASTKAAVYASAPGLAQGSLDFYVMSVGANSCAGNTTEATCKGYFDASQGLQATLTVRYDACSAIVYGTNYLPNCNLSSTTSIRVE